MSNTKWLPEEVIKAFNHLIAKQTGIVIREQDRESFCKKIYLRTQAIKAGSPVNYYQFLESNTLESYQEWEKLIALLVNNESYFFRDKEQYSELREMDLILCCNVFIYFKNYATAKVLDKIYQTLQPSRYFLTGHTELSAQNLSQFDKIVFPESMVYQPG